MVAEAHGSIEDAIREPEVWFVKDESLWGRFPTGSNSITHSSSGTLLTRANADDSPCSFRHY